MRPPRGKVILPSGELRRFRLPDLPTEPVATLARRRPGARNLVLGLAWFSFSVGCLSLSEPSFRPTAWAFAGVATVFERFSASDAPAASPEPTRTHVKAEPTLESAPAPERPQPPAAPPVVVSLPAVERAKPATHGAGSDALLPAWELPRDDVDVLPPLPRSLPSMPAAAARVDSVPVTVALPARRSKTPHALRAAAQEGQPPVAAAGREEPQRAALSVPTPPKQRVWTATVGTGCERAYQEFEQTLDMATGSGAPDVDPGAYAAVLEDFDRYQACDLNHEMDVSICVAVVNGQARGVTVKTQPANARLAACISRAVQRTSFPKSPRMDLVRTELIVR